MTQECRMLPWGKVEASLTLLTPPIKVVFFANSSCQPFSTFFQWHVHFQKVVKENVVVFFSRTVLVLSRCHPSGKRSPIKLQFFPRGTKYIFEFIPKQYLGFASRLKGEDTLGVLWNMVIRFNRCEISIGRSGSDPLVEGREGQGTCRWGRSAEDWQSGGSQGWQPIGATPRSPNGGGTADRGGEEESAAEGPRRQSCPQPAAPPSPGPP